MVRVMATGVFDLLHLGHLHYLEEAKRLGDELVVVVATDAMVRQRKHDPITPERMRLELVSALKPVDRAVLGHEDDIFRTVEEVRPDVIALGYDQAWDETWLRRELEQRGLQAKLVRLPRLDHDLDGTRKIIAKVMEWHAVREKLHTIEAGGKEP